MNPTRINLKQDLTSLQKAFIVIWSSAILISFINTIFEFFKVVSHGFYSVAFNDGLKQLILSCFYTYISLLLLQLLYRQRGNFMNLLSADGIKQVSRIFSVLINILIAKIVFSFIIIKYVVPKAADASIAKDLGYDVGTRFFKLGPHKDLIIAIAIVWVFMVVLGHAQKLKQEQDLTI